jgi:hypothetical protein
VQRKWVRWVSWAAVGLSLVLTAVVLWRGSAQLHDLEWRKFVLPMALGLLLYGLSLAVQAGVWTGAVARFTNTPPQWWDVEVFCTTHLMRRLPGPAYMAGRVMIYRDHGRGTGGALATNLLEWGGLILTGAAWALIGFLGWTGALIVAVFLGALVILWPKFRTWSRLPAKWQAVADLPVSWILLVLAAYALAWLLGGAILYLLLHAAAPGAPQGFGKAMSVWALAGGASILMIMVPAGLGVREFGLTVLLQPQVTAAIAFLVAVLMRVLFTVGDLLWGGLFWLFARHLSRKQLSS